MFVRPVTRYASTYFATMASDRPVCSYESKCYRRNPEHFKQVDHPHLDNLLVGSVEDKPVTIPETLSFECNNRNLLNEQLEILRKIAAEKYRAASSRDTKGSPASSRATESRPTSSRAGESSAASGRRENPQIVDLTSDAENARPARKSAREMIIERGQAPDYLPKAGKFLVKYEMSQPYNIFFTAVQKVKETWKQKLSVTFTEILDRSLGEIVSSMHLTFVVNVGWLCAQYLLAEQNPKMDVFYNHREDEGPVRVNSNINIEQVKSPYNFGSHHSKISILHYKDNGVRIIISSANLYEDDWDLRTQGLWISPHLPQLPASARDEDGESITGFKEDLIRYFSKYKQDTSKWRSILSRADFSSVKVAFVSSVPGLFYSTNECSRWGHRRLAKILGAHAELPDGDPCPTIVATASSIGSLGTSYNAWLSTDLVASMTKAENQTGRPTPAFKLIYPSIENYKRSIDLAEGSCCLSYHQFTHAKQKWIREHMHHWVATRSNRSRAMPHIKTFLRLSADERKVPWMVLGSANVSKAAWGYSDRNIYKILSYEVGVVFLPKFFNGGTYFPVDKADSTPDLPTLPIPFNIPLTPYSKTDEPFLVLAS